MAERVRKRIALLFVVQPFLTIGGSYRWLERIAHVLPSRGFDITFALPPFENTLEEFLARFPAVSPLRLQARSGTPAGRQRAIERAILEVRPDVVIPHLVADTFAGACRARRRGSTARLLYAAHEISPGMIADALDFHGAVDSIVVVSRALERIIASVAGLPSERLFRIPYGVPPPAAARTPRPEGEIRIGYAGRLDPDMRPLDLGEIVRGLAAAGVPYSFDIVGDGACRGELEESVRTETLAGRVHFRGACSREELYAHHYPSWDIFLRCSPREGFPIAIVEAMINGGVPVVSDFEGRKPEGVVRDGETGLVFPVGAPADAAARIVTLVRNGAELARLSATAASAAMEYTEDRMIEGWIHAFAETAALPHRSLHPRCQSPAAGGRIDRLLGAETGERLRRWLGIHHDTAVWPMRNHENDAQVERIAARIREVV